MEQNKICLLWGYFTYWITRKFVITDREQTTEYEVTKFLDSEVVDKC